MPKDIEYENANLIYDSLNCEEGIKCKNYIVCDGIKAKWWFNKKGQYICLGCDMDFGTWGDQVGKGVLETMENIECPICFEIKNGISQPRCDHFVCVDCFRRCYYGEERKNEPEFPYSEDIEEKYYEDPDNFNIEDFPLINLYNELHNKWDDEYEQKYDNERSLRCCPICRK